MKINEIRLRRFEAIMTPLSSKKMTVVVFEFKYKESRPLLLLPRITKRMLTENRR